MFLKSYHSYSAVFLGVQMALKNYGLCMAGKNAVEEL